MTRQNVIKQWLPEDLRVQLKGRVIEPGHTEYHSARRVFYGGIDRYSRGDRSCGGRIGRGEGGVPSAGDGARVGSARRGPQRRQPRHVRRGDRALGGSFRSLDFSSVTFSMFNRPAVSTGVTLTRSAGVNKVRNSTHRGRRYSRPRMRSPRSRPCLKDEGG